jgi:carbon-monoxide dehydrogenase large subunit
MGEYALGQAVKRSEDPRLLRGGGRFVDDMALPGMVFGHVLRSPHPHATIVSIDTAQAAAAPGVKAVLTGADWADSGYGNLPAGAGQKRRDGSALYSPPYPALVADRVRRVGDYVAFVIADTKDQARDAAELIEVAYEALPHIASTADATKPGAALVWDDCPDNICFVHLGGDKQATDAAFAAADHVVRETFFINRVSANTIEPRGSIGQYDATEDHYTIYTTLQQAHPYRGTLASKILKVPENKVRVVAGDIGGSFGMKSEIYNEVALVLWGSKVVGQPVKWISDRSEAFLSDAHGRDNLTTGELALDADGKFLGLRVTTIANLGAYLMATGTNPPVINLGTLAGVYTTPAIHVDVTAVFTNTNPMRPYRGAGRPEAAYVIERLADLAADEIGMDPAEIRRLNTIPPDAMPYKTALTFTYDSGEFEKNMDIALEMSGYTEFEQRRAAARASGKLRGIGLSNTIERAAAGGIEGGEIRFDRSGTVTILSGSITQGQGHETVYKQLVCDQLGLEWDEVRYVWGDTDKVAVGHGTGGSRSATLGGSALLLAADKVIDKAKKIAAHMLEAASQDIAFDDGVFTISGTDRKVTIQEVARAASNPAGLPDGVEPGLVGTATYGAKMQNFPNGCHVCEVEIDPDTGTVEMVGYDVVDDVGTVMNPLLVKGQIHGGIAQGAGQALIEDIAFDPESGQLLTGSFMDYAMPRADDFSMFEVKSNPVPTATNPLGVKGCGEAGTVGALPAVTNAIVDALSHLGVRHIEMPATPERIWRAIRRAGG